MLVAEQNVQVIASVLFSPSDGSRAESHARRDGPMRSTKRPAVDLKQKGCVGTDHGGDQGKGVPFETALELSVTRTALCPNVSACTLEECSRALSA